MHARETQTHYLRKRIQHDGIFHGVEAVTHNGVTAPRGFHRPHNYRADQQKRFPAAATTKQHDVRCVTSEQRVGLCLFRGELQCLTTFVLFAL
jgi:hypothetical protein